MLDRLGPGLVEQALRPDAVEICTSAIRPGRRQVEGLGHGEAALVADCRGEPAQGGKAQGLEIRTNAVRVA
ncbi:hypothetical protein [Caldovatus aquaticus]|uniref:Uncharacterized protein n=1 Tax=Caldovatus aquaticus TaxID=2865671 RepID=A0ABS7F4H5_9PROT|nr:hypothetical protein [Caldovatus aquaticus]MBW8270522.1 hypothetical protein [Caldovatus aquaticus]